MDDEEGKTQSDSGGSGHKGRRDIALDEAKLVVCTMIGPAKCIYTYIYIHK